MQHKICLFNKARKVISTREEEGLSIRETAKQFRIGPASVSRWINQIASKASTTRQQKSDKSELIKDVEPYPDAYQKERAERFGVCQKAIWQALKKLGLTYKKTLRHPKADESARQAFQQKIQQYEKEGKPIVFIDESGFPHDTPRTHGYSPKGQRCFGLKNGGAKGRTNVIGSLFKILCKCLSSEVTVKTVTELDNKATHCHTPVL
ncbi:IS630 transposase-related protein [Symbiopectobacterium sp. RP]|uniref:IS630 transposase-related protein n=1 Tax=Symbiopectobacterium sp. RP TaxID=3248553 RepID=UPI003D2A1F7D